MTSWVPSNLLKTKYYCTVMIISEIIYSVGQHNLAKTSNCIFLSSIDEFSEFPTPSVSDVVLEKFVRKCDTTSILLVGEGWGCL